MKRFILVYKSLLFISCLSVSGVVNALPIQQNVVDNYAQIQHFGPVGQSFVAEDIYVTADFWITEYNQFVAPSDYDISFSLYEGTGTGGNLVGAGSLSGLSDGFLGWAGFDLSAYILNIGSTYSLMIDNDNARWGFGFAESNLYSSGQLILSQDPTNIFPNYSQYDMAFRINPVQVTEPFSIILFLMGIGILVMVNKRPVSRFNLLLTAS